MHANLERDVVRPRQIALNMAVLQYQEMERRRQKKSKPARLMVDSPSDDPEE